MTNMSNKDGLSWSYLIHTPVAEKKLRAKGQLLAVFFICHIVKLKRGNSITLCLHIQTKIIKER